MRQPPRTLGMLTIKALPTSSSLSGSDPWARLDEEDLTTLLLNVLGRPLNAEQRDDIADLLEAVLPAAVYLRDEHDQRLDAAAVVQHAQISGLTALAVDPRLTPLMRLNAEAMARRHTAYLHRAVQAARRASRDQE